MTIRIRHCTLAPGVALSFEKALGLKPVPIRGMDTRFSIRQYWHLRQDADPVHGWFRRLVKEVALPLDL